MKQVKLYTLKEEEVYTTNDHIALVSLPACGTQHPIRIRNSDEFILSEPKTILAVPVEYYEKKSQDNFGRVHIDERFLVAFDPKIRELLCIEEGELKVENKRLEENINKLQTENSRLTTDNMFKDTQIKTISEDNEKLSEYSEKWLDKYLDVVNMSFWKRLVFLFTRKLET